MLLKKLKILILEDLPSDAELICRELKKAQLLCVTHVVNCKADYIKAITEFSPDIILSDHTLPSFTSLEALQLAQQLVKIPFVLVTATMSEEFAISVMKEGAWDYVPKNQLKRLPGAIIKAMDKFEFERLRQHFVFDLILNEAYMQEAERIAKYGSWEFDVFTKKLKLSKEAYNILGSAQEQSDSLTQDILNAVHPADLPHVKLVIKNIAKTPDVDIRKENIRLLAKDGLYRTIKTGFVLKHDPLGKLLRVNGFIQDVTDCASLEEKLLKSEERFACLAESINEASIFVLDASGHIISLNKEARSAFENSGADMTKKHISELYLNEEIHNEDIITHLQKNTGIHKIETKGYFKTNNGSSSWGDVMITRESSQSENLPGFLMVIRKNKPYSIPLQGEPAGAS